MRERLRAYAAEDRHTVARRSAQLAMIRLPFAHENEKNPRATEG